MTEGDDIAIVDLADELQVRKQRIFKILPRLGIRTTQRRDSSRGNRNVAIVSRGEAAAIRSAIQGSSASPGINGARSVAAVPADDIGFFYLIQLEPEHDAARFKVGFTMDLDGRLRKHRCSAPFARYVGSWPCRRAWERAAIDCVTAGCDQLHTEVFRAVSLTPVSKRAYAFFAMMPGLEAELRSEDTSNDDEQALVVEARKELGESVG